MATTVLIVDDEAPFVQTLTKRLARRKLDILSALSGQEALGLIGSGNHVDVVILDVRMPGMDGIETLRQIKLGDPGIEVILLTGHGSMESAVQGMKLGALDYLMKPCSIDQVMSRIEDAMKKRRKRLKTQAR